MTKIYVTGKMAFTDGKRDRGSNGHREGKSFADQNSLAWREQSLENG